MDEMELPEIERLLDELMRFQVQEVHITGGEPLIRRDVFEIIRAVTGRGVRVRLQTNGLHLNRTVVEQLRELALGSIMVSVDGFGTCHEAIRGHGTFAPTMAGVGHAVASGLHVRVNSVVHLDNMESMFELMSEVCRLGVDVHSFFYYTANGRGLTSGLREVPGRIWVGFLDRLRQHWIDLEQPATQIVAERCFIDLSEWDRRYHDCRMSSPNYAQVLCDGRVVPCTLFVSTPYAVGNVRWRSMDRLWHDPESWKAFERIRTAGQGDPAGAPNGCWAYHVGQNRIAGRDPRWESADGLIPICPIVKFNVVTRASGAGTVDVI